MYTQVIENYIIIKFLTKYWYYGCDIYRNQISSGDYYSELKPLYIICILGKNYPHQDESEWDENNLISHYKFIETRTQEFAT